MLVKEYEDYLGKIKLGDRTRAIYSKRIQKLLEEGYSEGDLVGAIGQLIQSHSKGGKDYNEKDHGNTSAALSKLKDYIQSSYIESFFVAYDEGFLSFPKQECHVSAYTITDGTITITYKKGHCFVKTVTRKIPQKQYRRLIDIFMENKDYLSASNTAINTSHGPSSAYRYVFGECYGSDCASLFAGKRADKALDEYKTWMNQFNIES